MNPALTSPRSSVCIDSLGCIFPQFASETAFRREIFSIVSALNDLGITSVITAERLEEYGPIARHGVEEFVADNVVLEGAADAQAVKERPK